MKRYFVVLVLLFPLTCFGQPPGYYSSATGLNGESLRIALKSIIRPHTALTYTPGLWNAYHTTDVKPNGKLWDVYSDVPGGTPAYEYTIGTNQCSSSSPSAENGCYNREHTWPQSKFGSAAPMQTDLFIVYPTDYFVNNRRGDLPYGKVGTPAITFTNGSKIGNNVYSGSVAGNCFEPIDSFKGDLARTYFYVSACYRDDSTSFISWEMANRVTLTPAAAQMLLEWHHLDPVSKKERDRNDAVFALQGNRNPFIDHPEYADCIWGTGDCATNAVPGLLSNDLFSAFPNPVADVLNLKFVSAVATGRAIVKLVSITGVVFYCQAIDVPANGQLAIPVVGFPRGLYFVQVACVNTSFTRKIQIN